MTYIETKKAEVRDLIYMKLHGYYAEGETYQNADKYADNDIAKVYAVIDELFNEIEEKTIGENLARDNFRSDDFMEGYMARGREVLEAFQHLRTGVEINPTPHTETQRRGGKTKAEKIV